MLNSVVEIFMERGASETVEVFNTCDYFRMHFDRLRYNDHCSQTGKSMATVSKSLVAKKHPSMS